MVDTSLKKFQWCYGLKMGFEADDGDMMVSKSTNSDHLTANKLIIGNENTTHIVLIQSLKKNLKNLI